MYRRGGKGGKALHENRGSKKVVCFFSLHVSLRRGNGLNKSSSENVRDVVDGWIGLLRLNKDGFLIPKRLKIDFCVPGVHTVAVCDDVCMIGLLAPPATCSCSRSDVIW